MPDCFLHSWISAYLYKMKTRSKAEKTAAEPDDDAGPSASAQADESSLKAPTVDTDVEHQARFAELMISVGLNPLRLCAPSAPTSTRSIGFCVIWVCISSSSSSAYRSECMCRRGCVAKYTGDQGRSVEWTRSTIKLTAILDAVRSHLHKNMPRT